MLSDASELPSRLRGEILVNICQSMPFSLLMSGCVVQPSPCRHGLMSCRSTQRTSYCLPELLLPVSGAIPIPIIAICIPILLYFLSFKLGQETSQFTHFRGWDMQMTDGVLPSDVCWILWVESFPPSLCHPVFLPKNLKFHIASPTIISLYMWFALEMTKEATVIFGLSTPPPLPLHWKVA